MHHAVESFSPARQRRTPVTSMSELVQVTHAAGLCEIRLNRPEKRNAITFAMYEALAAAFASAQADEAVQALLLSGAGPGFCAGNDLHDFLAGPNFSSAHPVMGFLKGLATLGKPLIAAVHGQTVGIGVTLLLHCDLVIAARTTQFSMPFVSLGLVPEAASSLLLPRLIGAQRAAELLLLGKPFDASAAHALGLVNRVVEETVLLSEARALAQGIARQPPLALAATRRLLRGDPTEIIARMEEEARIFGGQLKSDEFRNAVSAFLARAKAR
jgi:enoyl-CoA hydratase/carnithine racemase